MKEVILVRHAKSDWENLQLNDVDRYLNERGYADAYAMSTWFCNNKPSPDILISSTATRAISTALIFARRLQLNSHQICLEPQLYEAFSTTLISIIQKLPHSCKSAMLFGHNPGFTDLCNLLSNQLKLDNLPTCGLVSIQFEMKAWSEIEPGGGIYHYHQFPKSLKN